MRHFHEVAGWFVLVVFVGIGVAQLVLLLEWYL